MTIFFIILLAILTRFIPHMPNFAPVTALAIFSAANMDWKIAAGLTLAVRFISDIFLGFFSWPMMVAVYACHLAGVLFGVWIKKSTTPSRQGGAPLLFQEGNAPRLSPDIVRSSPPKVGGVPREAGGGGMNYWTKIMASSLGASAIFFFVTNFAFLYSTYPHNITGIIAAYTNGLPFFRGTLLGDLGYTTALFGAYDFAVYLKSIRVKLQRAIV